MARKYQHTMELLPQIKEMLAQGMTQKQVEDALGLSGYRPVHALLKRERKKEIQGISKQRGRKPAKTLAEYKYENKRLKMENELLRDFLGSPEGGEGNDKVCGYISAQARISGAGHVPAFWSIQKRLL